MKGYFIFVIACTKEHLALRIERRVICQPLVSSRSVSRFFKLLASINFLKAVLAQYCIVVPVDLFAGTE